jgi:hypothetical protein
MSHFDRRERKKTGDVESTDISKLRAFMKVVVGKLMKAPNSEPFLYPVDSSVFPEYYVAIEHPMDLTTIKDRIPSYCMFEDFLADLSLIWKNCMSFNAPESDIVTWVEEIRKQAQALVAEKFDLHFDSFFLIASDSSVELPDPSGKSFYFSSI